jgi:hypothetical protein
VTGTTYAVGNKVSRAGTHKVYEDQSGGVSNTAPESDTVRWVEIGYINKWRMFDSSTSSLTTMSTYPEWSAASYSIGDRVQVTSTGKIYEDQDGGASATSPNLDTARWTEIGNINEIRVVLNPVDDLNAIALINVSGESVNVTINDWTGSEFVQVYNEDYPLLAPVLPTDWYSYFYTVVGYRPFMVIKDLPIKKSPSEIIISVTSSLGSVSIGTLLVGLVRDLSEGGPLLGAKIGLVDYSRKERDQFGNTVIVERAYTKRMTVDFYIMKYNMDWVQQLFADIRTTPTLWIADENYEALTIYGYYKEFTAVIPYPDRLLCNLEVESMI